MSEIEEEEAEPPCKDCICFPICVNKYKIINKRVRYLKSSVMYLDCNLFCVWYVKAHMPNIYLRTLYKVDIC